jgi:outer membrane protein assembly factor BamA
LAFHSKYQLGQLPQICSGILIVLFKIKFRIQADLTLKDMDDHYYGVGYDSGRYTQQSDSTTAYHRTWAWFNPRVLLKVKENLYAGLDWDINFTRATDPASAMQTDPNFLEFGPENFNHGLGFILQYDSRDIPVNAWRGSYFSGRSRFYSTAIGGDNDYQIYDIDYRTYIPLGRPGRTLAGQFRTRIGKDDVPWAELSQIGTPFDLRGYRWGRYRDKSMMYLMLEFRYMIPDADRAPYGLSPHGLVAWVGGGSIALKAKDFEDWLPNFGIGYRFEVQSRMNVRLDVGFAQEHDGWAPAVYFNFNEAF